MLTTGEVAKLFQVSAQTVINWLDQGRMPYERIGRGPRRLTESTVLNYIREIGISLTALDQSIYAKALKQVYSENNVADESAVAMIGSNLKIIGWNEGVKSITGYTNIDVLGKSLTDFINRVNGSEESLESILKRDWSGPSMEFSVVHSSKAGKQIPIKLSASKVYAMGSLTGYTLVYQKPQSVENAAQN